MRNLAHHIKMWYNETVIFFIVFYAVGITGMLIPSTFGLFTLLIPFALLLSSAALFFFHSEFDFKTKFVFTVIYFTAFVFETIGVNTGAIFGSYYYGKSLGLSAFNTPVIIGLNWLLLVYLTSSVMEKTKWPAVLQVPVAALLMVGYDLIVEQVAPALDMWHWVENVVPVKNYVAWFILALVFHSLLKIFKIKTKNRLAAVILICQTVFFLALYVTFNLIR